MPIIITNSIHVHTHSDVRVCALSVWLVTCQETLQQAIEHTNVRGTNCEWAENVQTMRRLFTTLVEVQLFLLLLLSGKLDNSHGKMIHSDETLGSCTHTPWSDHFISWPCKQWNWNFQWIKLKVGLEIFVHVNIDSWLPVSRASWPDVGDHKGAGLVPVFMGSSYRGREGRVGEVGGVNNSQTLLHFKHEPVRGTTTE